MGKLRNKQLIKKYFNKQQQSVLLEMSKMSQSELILNADGSVYHLKLLPQDIAETIITVGDPERVEMIAAYFDEVFVVKKNREFHTITGKYKSKHITVISTGIGTDNIDIVLNELAILNKIDLSTLEEKQYPKPLSIIRIGTSGTICSDVALGSTIFSDYAIGLDGLMNYYNYKSSEIERKYQEIIQNNLVSDFPFIKPYIVQSSNKLKDKISDGMILGITATCQGFYNPQGRFIWSKNQASILDVLKSISLDGNSVTNFEMESSAILGLSRYFGFEACSVSLILANRITHEFTQNAEEKMKKLIEMCLDRIALLEE